MASVEELYVVLHAQSAPFIAGMKAASASGESFAARMGGTAALIQKTVTALGLVGVGVAAVSLKMATDFEYGLKRLQTSAGESEKNLKMVGDGIMAIARATGTGTDQLLKGAYRIESAGYHGADALKILKAAAEGAKAEQADLDVVSNALTSTMKAYKAPISEVSDYMSKYVAIVSNGKVSMQELSSAMPNVEAVAAAAGISFEQLGGAMATMTTHGESAHQAAQWLSFAIRNLTSPNMVAVKAMEQLGLSSIDVAHNLGERGLTGTIRLISEAILSKMGPDGKVMLGVLKQSASAADDARRMLETMPPAVKKLSEAYISGGVSFGDWRAAMKKLPTDQANMASQFKSVADRVNSFSDVVKAGGPVVVTYQDQLKKIMGGANGMQAALQLGGKYMGDFEGNVAKISAAVVDADGHVHGFAESQETLRSKVDRVKAAFETLGIEIGMKLMPPVKALLDFFLEHKTISMILVGILGGVLLGSVVALGVAIAIAIGPIGWITAALVALGVVAYQIAENWDAIWGKIKDVAAAVGRWFSDVWSATWGAVRDFTVGIWRDITGWIKRQWQALASWAAGAWHTVTDPLVAGWRWFANVTTAIWNAIAGFFQKWWPLLLVIFAFPIAVLVAIWNHFGDEIWAGVTWVWDAVMAYLTAVWDGIKVLAGIAWAAIQTVILTPLENAWHGIVIIAGFIGDGLAAAWSMIAGTVSTWWNAIKDRILGPLENARRGIEIIGIFIGVAVYNAMVNAWNGVKAIGSWFVQIGEAIINGVVRGVGNGSGVLYDKLRGVANSALNAAKSFLGISSPSRVFASQVGRWIPEGIAAGVAEHTPAAVRSVDAMTRTLGQRGNSLAFRAPGGALTVGASGGGSSITNVTVHVAGSVLAEKELYDTVQRRALRYAKNNPTNGLSLARG